MVCVESVQVEVFIVVLFIWLLAISSKHLQGMKYNILDIFVFTSTFCPMTNGVLCILFKVSIVLTNY